MTTTSSRETPTNAPAWSDDDLRDNPHARADKAKRVRDMFAAIAGKYDLNNRVHSFGQDQRWRRTAVKMAQLKGMESVLDVACGTGDLSMAFADKLGELTQHSGPPIIGMDFTFEMLPLAFLKSAKRFARVACPENSLDTIAWCQGDAMALPFPDASFDVVSIAFGLRNVADVDVAMAEFVRVLRPGGRVVVLEFSQPKNPVIRWGSRLYTEKVMPWTATWIARDRSGAYKYLPTSVATFMGADGVRELMGRHGLEAFGQKNLNFGVAAVTAGRKT